MNLLLNMSVLHSFGKRQETMYLELDTVLSISALFLLLKGKTPDKSDQKVKRTINSKTYPPCKIHYFAPHPFLIVVSPCTFKYKINTAHNRIPGKQLIILIKLNCTYNMNFFQKA